jgi:hypothetical protein
MSSSPKYLLFKYSVLGFTDESMFIISFLAPHIRAADEKIKKRIPFGSQHSQ